MKNNYWRQNKHLVFLTFLLNIFILCASTKPIFGYYENIGERFKGSDKIAYDVFYNGIPAGKIIWKYLGKEKVNGKETEVIFLDSNTKILNLLNLASKEKVFLDMNTHLPVKAERDVIFFGKQENIEEIYNQEAGSVRIINSKHKDKAVILHQTKPIHNILALLYFFPQDIALIKDKKLYFNLPTQKVTVKLVSEGVMQFGKEKKEIYLLSGRGGQRFNLWLDKKDRSPIKMEFLSIAGKVTIMRKSA
jgi:hypothetical protein